MFEGFPYTNFHELNLDWIVKIAKDFLDQYTHIQEVIESGEQAISSETEEALQQLDAKAENIENTLNEWYTTHSADLAAQLASALNDLNSWYTTHQNYLNQTLADNITAFNTAANAKAAETIASIPDNYTNLSNVTKSGVNGHQEGIVNALGSNINAAILEQGGFTPTGLNDSPTATDRIRTKYHILVKEGCVIDCNASAAVKASVSYYYDNDMSTARISATDWLDFPITITAPGSSYIRVIIKKADESNLTPAIINMFSVSNGYTVGNGNAFNKISEIMNTLNNNNSPTIVQGGFDDKGQNLPGADRVRTDEYIAVNNNTVITFTGTNVQAAVSFYTAKNGDRAKTTGWLDSPISLAGYNYPFIRILFKRTSAYAISPSHVTSLNISNSLVLDKEETFNNNYTIDSVFNKKNIKVSHIGNLNGEQAFCIYDSKYFSVSEGKLYIQDSSFDLVSQHNINIGHANSCQLSESVSGHAYISGWDDQKVYEVDLMTQEIVETYTLPTTGYTTVAVDDINKIMYIFQRNSSPETDTYYNVIKYNYDSEEVISTKKLTEEISYMQSVDFINGKILIAAGGGSGTTNRFYIYDTMLTMIGEIKMNDYAAIEPEGIFIDRTTKDVYISFANWPTIELYKIG